jgi:hypothetical protein
MHWADLLGSTHYDLHETSSESLRVAVVAEIFPKPDQGGSIRLIRLLDQIIKLRHETTLYVREMRAPRTYRHTVGVIPDGLFLTRLKADLKKYDLVLSCFWFWRTEQSPQILPIPLLVSNIITEQVLDIQHITISDDLQYVRCFKTVVTTQEESVCEEIFRMELEVWENPLIFKLFITEEDMYHARNISRMSAKSAAVQTYFQPSLKSSRYSSGSSGNKCTLAYFGSAHPANVQALLQLFESAGETMLEFHLVAQKRCTLLIAGDDRWHEISDSPALEPLQDFGIILEVVGFVKNINTLMRRVNLMILPVVVGGTGVSTKVLSCIEMGMPFISTSAGNRGFSCDDECDQLFFRSSPHELLVSAIEIVNSPVQIKLLRKKLKQMAIIDPKQNVLPALLSARVVTMEQLSHKSVNTPGELSCKPCVSADKCEEVCETPKKYQRKTEVSIYASIKGTNSEKIFLEGYLTDILRQDMIVNWEVVLATASTSFFTLINDTLLHLVVTTLPGTLRFRAILMKNDVGLYETWDYLISTQTQGFFLQNWNIDDRKHKSAIRMKYNILCAQPTNTLVSSGVVVSLTEDQSWPEVRTSRFNDEWFTSTSGYYSLYTMFRKGPTDKITSFNLPHNSPLYRRSAHEKYGTFSATWQKKPLRLDVSPTCSDFRFWTLPLQEGESYYHTSMPLEVYYVRPDSHNRLPENKIEACVGQVVSSIFPHPKEVKHALGLDSMRVERILLSISSEEALAMNSLIAALHEIIRKGYVPHILVDEKMVDLSLHTLPKSVIISSFQRLENPAFFKLGMFLSSRTTAVSAALKLRKEGYFLRHSCTYHVGNVDEISSIIESML